jgi:hypothetical protein
MGVAQTTALQSRLELVDTLLVLGGDQIFVIETEVSHVPFLQVGSLTYDS